MKGAALWGGGVSARFRDRADAGKRLAEKLAPRVDPKSTVVLALPRGGVPVAHEISTMLGIPLDILLVRKLGVPWQPELAFGAVSSGDVTVVNEDVVDTLRLTSEEVQEVVQRELEELARRERVYRGDRTPLKVAGKTVVIVDDGIATGSTVRAALSALERQGAAHTIVACPVAPPDTVERLFDEADDVVCLKTPPDLVAIGLWYDDFTPVYDEDVLRLLESDAPHPQP
jgi:putative phosphoribosyl transferase